jgi:hypothetical protein
MCLLARVQRDPSGPYIIWTHPAQPTPAGSFTLDSSQVADVITDFPLNEQKVYLRDHSPETRTMGSCRCAAYQVTVAEVMHAFNAGMKVLELPLSSAWQPTPTAPHRLT